jgi:hypothetical protein
MMKLDYEKGEGCRVRSGATYKYLGAKAVVVTAMMNETIATTGGSTMCRYRSPVLSACQALVRIAIVPMRYGGAVSRRVVMLFLPRPLTTLCPRSYQLSSVQAFDARKALRKALAYVGKKVVTVPAAVKPYVVARSSQAFGSLKVLFVSSGHGGWKGKGSKRT